MAKSAQSTTQKKRAHFTIGASFLAVSKGKMCVWTVVDRTETEEDTHIRTKVIGKIDEFYYDYVATHPLQASIGLEMVQMVAEESAEYQMKTYTNKQISFLHRIRDKVFGRPAIHLIEEK